MKKKSLSTLIKFVTAAMLSAVAFVLYLWEIPFFPSTAHLKFDLSNIPVLTGGIVLGTPYAVIIALVKNLLELLTRGLGTQMGFGNLMDFVSCCLFVVPFCLIYKKLSKSKERNKLLAVIIADIVSLFSVVVLGIGANYLIDPAFFKYFMGVTLTSETLWPAILSATALNALKGAMLTIVSFPIVLVLADRVKKVMRQN